MKSPMDYVVFLILFSNGYSHQPSQDDSYCGTGCQPGFGDCSPAQASSTQPGPTDTVSVPGPSSSSSSLTVSQDATCGDGVTCEGSAFGNCCSINGWCGSVRKPSRARFRLHAY